jgi:hypothetical protein
MDPGLSQVFYEAVYAGDKKAKKKGHPDSHNHQHSFQASFHGLCVEHLSELQNSLASQPISGISQRIACTLTGKLTTHSKLSTRTEHG